MRDVLKEKLHRFLVHNNPDLLVSLQGAGRISQYLVDKVTAIEGYLNELVASEMPLYLVEEQCLNELTRDLRPSKYNYLIHVLEEDFEQEYHRLRESGIMTYEVVNLIQHCSPLFSVIGFSEDNEEDRHLRYAITSAVKEYFDLEKVTMK